MEYANDTKREIKILPKNKMNPRGCICIGNKPKREKCKMIVQGHKKEKGHDKVKHRICKEQNMVILLVIFTDCMDSIKGKEKGKERKEKIAMLQ